MPQTVGAVSGLVRLSSFHVKMERKDVFTSLPGNPARLPPPVGAFPVRFRFAASHLQTNSKPLEVFCRAVLLLSLGALATLLFLFVTPGVTFPTPAVHLLARLPAVAPCPSVPSTFHGMAPVWRSRLGRLHVAGSGSVFDLPQGDEGGEFRARFHMGVHEARLRLEASYREGRTDPVEAFHRYVKQGYHAPAEQEGSLELLGVPLVPPARAAPLYLLASQPAARDVHLELWVDLDRDLGGQGRPAVLDLAPLLARPLRKLAVQVACLRRNGTGASLRFQKVEVVDLSEVEWAGIDALLAAMWERAAETLRVRRLEVLACRVLGPSQLRTLKAIRAPMTSLREVAVGPLPTRVAQNSKALHNIQSELRTLAPFALILGADT